MQPGSEKNWAGESASFRRPSCFGSSLPESHPASLIQTLCDSDIDFVVVGGFAALLIVTAAEAALARQRATAINITWRIVSRNESAMIV